jgi:hypothetical protein
MYFHGVLTDQIFIPNYTTTMLMRFNADHEMLWELPLFGDTSYVVDIIA